MTYVTGYSCAPNNPDMWWCPEVGYSMSEKHHLFATEAEALDKAIAEAEGQAVALEQRLGELKARLTPWEPRGIVEIVEVEAGNPPTCLVRFLHDHSGYKSGTLGRYYAHELEEHSPSDRTQAQSPAQ